MSAANVKQAEIPFDRIFNLKNYQFHSYSDDTSTHSLCFMWLDWELILSFEARAVIAIYESHVCNSLPDTVFYLCSKSNLSIQSKVTTYWNFSNHIFFLNLKLILIYRFPAMVRSKPTPPNVHIQILRQIWIKMIVTTPPCCLIYMSPKLF